MNKVNVLPLLILSLILFGSCKEKAHVHDKAKNEAIGQIFLADPTIFLHDGVYYLYGTSGEPKLSEKKGFSVYTSKDLQTWEGPKGASGGLALKKGDAFGD